MRGRLIDRLAMDLSRAVGRERVRCGAVRCGTAGERERTSGIFFFFFWGGIFTGVAFMAFFHGHWARLLGMGFGDMGRVYLGLGVIVGGVEMVVLLPRTIHEGVVHVTPICGEPMTRSSTICLCWRMY